MISGRQKWRGKSTLFDAEFTVTVPRPLPRRQLKVSQTAGSWQLSGAVVITGLTHDRLEPNNR